MLTRLHFYISTSTFVRSEADIMHRLFFWAANRKAVKSDVKWRHCYVFEGLNSIASGEEGEKF